MILSSREIKKRLGIGYIRHSTAVGPAEEVPGARSAPDTGHSPDDICPDEGSASHCTEKFSYHMRKDAESGGSVVSSSEGTPHRSSFRGSGGLVIDPYSGESLQPASYDLRAAQDALLPRGTTTLVPSMEWVELPAELAATLRCRSSFGRRGVILTGGFVDPGFRGQLTLSLINMGPEEIRLVKGERVVQMILHQVFDGEELYDGRYQDSHGAVGAR
jgi:dCTP deaminase